MAKPHLKNINGHFVESDYENALISFFENENWQYLFGDSISRASKKEVLYMDDLLQFLTDNHKGVKDEELRRIADNVRLVGSDTDFATLHKAYKWMINGLPAIDKDGRPTTVNLIDFSNPENNIFRVVNQFTVEYINNGEVKNRRPDVLLYVNGMPVCVIELKNPADANATIKDAWEQINIRYWRDIPHLLHYCPLACISDGVKTRLGTVRTPYEHFYAWRRVEDGDRVSTMPFKELETMVKGVYRPERFLEIFRDYVYFQDENYDSDEKEIVCRYPQFFATRLLRESVVNSVKTKSGKGGTYFGATGCGKTYTMAFLARQLSMRCSDEIGSPTILMIVDREDLQKQGAKLFTKSTEFLGLGEVSIVKSRNKLREELKARESGGFFICTIQKFCDRKDDPIGLINNRSNIICFSDEAHRTQIEGSKRIQFSDDADENMKAMISKPYASVLREALPNATFVGFTGTPIAETYQTFGDEIDRYTMDQAVADEITVPIKYHPRIAKVLLNSEKVKEIEAYYAKCAEEGSTKEDIAKSKKAMSSLEVILGEPERLDRLAKDIHDHYMSAIANDPDRVQKAMIVCSKREIAYNLLLKFKDHYPEWFVERKTPEGVMVTPEELKKMKEMPTIAMVASVGSNDEKSMYEYLGGVKNDKRSEELDAAFKQEHSNFRIVIVVDMWITGFDVECLTYMYNDKPLQKHSLIQTISRANRKYPGKEYGLIVDYIGIRDQMMEARKMYGGESSVALTKDDIEQATLLFREFLLILKRLFKDYDLTPFLDVNTDPVIRYTLLAQAAEYVFSSVESFNSTSKEGKKTKKVSFKTYFLQYVKRMRKAYDLCQPSGELDEEESALAQCFMAIAGMVYKMNGTDAPDTDTMNRRVAKMVEEALKYNHVESILEDGEEMDIFGPEFTERLSDIKMPASKLEMLIKLLRSQISEYGKVNQIASKKFQEMLEETIKLYHERRKFLSEEEAGDTQEQTAEDIIKEATEQALAILNGMKADRESFRKLGLTFEEKAFYDILIALRDKNNFVYGEDKTLDGIVVNEKCKSLARKIKEIVDAKSSFADWLNNQRVREQLKLDIKICLVKNGYPPQYTPEVFREVMDQVENFNENSGDSISEVSPEDNTIEKEFSIKEEFKKKIIQVHASFHEGFIPLYSLRVACGYFDGDDVPEAEGWVDATGNGFTPDPKRHFAVHAKGNSMQPKIQDGDICVFEWYKAGSRNGEIVLTQTNAIDADYGAEYTIKQYRSEKTQIEDGWQHSKVELIPLNKEYGVIELNEEMEYRTVGILKCVL